MMRLARCSTQPMREHCWPSPLPQPLSEPVRLFSGCEPEELPKDPAEELPEELRMVESQKLEEKAEKTKTRLREPHLPCIAHARVLLVPNAQQRPEGLRGGP